MTYIQTIILTLLISSWAHAAPVEIIRAIPQGETVEEVRQITLTFNQKMVPLGQMARTAKELGISVQPEIKCQWRWLDPSNLTCQLADSDQLLAANTYLLTIQPGLKSENGSVLNKPYVLRFSTARPKVTYTLFEDWRHPSIPRISLYFNQDVNLDTVVKATTFISGKKSIRALRSETQETRQAASNREVTLEPETALPLDSSVSLRILAGIESKTGPLRGEASTAIQFDTFPEFEFLGVSCRTQDGGGNNTPHISGDIECSPLDGVALNFSAPVQKEEISGKLKAAPSLSAPGKETEVWETVSVYTHRRNAHKQGQRYQVPLPNHLLAQKNYVLKADGVSDVFGRQLSRAINVAFKTSARPPAVYLPTPIAVLEKYETTDVPIFVTNLQTLHLEFQTLTAAGVGAQQKHTLQVPKFEDNAFAIPMEARKLLNGSSGFVEGRLTTTPLLKGKAERFSLQVTPFQVIAKIGYMNSMIWVSDLKSGKNVVGAKVELLVMSADEIKPGESFNSAQTGKDGIATVSATTEWPKLEHRSYYAVRVTQASDLAILPLTYPYSGGGNSPYYYGEGDGESGSYGSQGDTEDKFLYRKAWGTTTQGVYKPGDKVSFKFYLRNQNNRHLIAAPSQGYTLHITNPAGDDVFVKDQITLNAFGAWSGEFQLPATAPVGWYNAHIKGPVGQQDLHVFRFLAADFTPVPFKVEATLNAKFIRPGDTLKIDTLATMHAGGPFAKAPLRLVGIFSAGFFTSDNAKVKDFTFDSYSVNEQSNEVLKVEDQSLDAKGGHQHSLKIDKMIHSFGTLMVESAVQDDRGKNSASSARINYSGLDRRVGLKQTSWLHNKGEKMNLLYAVVDDEGNPTRGTQVKIKFEYDRVKVAKVKGAGNAYLSQYEHVWETAGDCGGASQADPVRCDFVPKEAGSYRATATIEDTHRAVHSLTNHFYVVGPGYVSWESPETEPLEIIPEKKEYKVGDKAKFLVKNPLPGAQALITIERYGILKSWTMLMKDSAVLIEVPIEDDYVPGFNVSVSLTSPRIEKSGPIGVVDLGKPSARFGTFHVRVEDPYKRIQVDLKSDKKEYRPRDKVKIKLKARSVHPRKPEEPIELAVVVLDEAVLSLIQGGEKYFDPYKGFYDDAGLNVDTYSLIARLVGRQKFEKKGANSGGAGGLSQDLLLRNLFKFVAYWNPSLKPNSSGEAEFELTVPDNLTGWRVFAMAVSPTDRMGLGQLSFKVNKPTELRPVLPNQVSEGDKFRAGFSVLNRTDKTRKINVKVQADGSIKAASAKLAQEFTLELPPYERKSVFMDVQADTVKEHRGGLSEIRFQATAGDGIDKDGLVSNLPVKKRRDFETAAAYGTTTEDKVTENIEFPKDIYPDVGGVSVTLAPSVIGNVEGAFKYLQTYPYLCWEQRLTKGVMASHYLRLKDRLPTTAWPEAKTQVLSMLNDAAAFQAPSGGMTFWSPVESHVSPYLSAYTAVAFVWLREAGYKIPSAVERKLHGYLKNYLRNKVETTFFDEGMRSTVRAVALYALVKSKTMGTADVKRYLPAMSQMSLFGQANYLMAAIAAGRTEPEQAKTLKTILNKSSRTAGKVLFNEKLGDGYWLLLTTPLRDNCSVLSALTAAQQRPALKTQVADLPFRMVRAITQSRGSRDAFENTQENMFCMQALIDYAKVYEATPPKMQIRVALDGKAFGQGEFNKITEPMKTVERIIQASDVGRKSVISIERQGQGRLYYATRVTYAPREANSSEINSGIDVKREYYVERKGQWIQLSSPMTVQRGELVKVDIFVSLPAARNYLAISDPVPGGLEPVNRDLANESQVDSDKGGFKGTRGSIYWKHKDWREFSLDGWSFYHQELRHDSVRFFADYLMPGNYHLTYTAQAIATGEFLAGPTHGEEMYDPDVFGKSKPASFVIQEK